MSSYSSFSNFCTSKPLTRENLLAAMKAIKEPPSSFTPPRAVVSSYCFLLAYSEVAATMPKSGCRDGYHALFTFRVKRVAKQVAERHRDQTEPRLVSPDDFFFHPEKPNE